MEKSGYDYAILGAGAIGCYTGGWLANSGHSVLFVGRPSILDVLASQGLALESVEGRKSSVSTLHLQRAESSIPANTSEADSVADGSVTAASIGLTESPSDLAKCKTILVCVKSASTDEAAAQIREYAPHGSAVISLQNGLGAARILKENLPDHRVFAGMVTYNVVREGNHFRQSTSGPITIELPPDAALAQTARAVANDLNECGIQAYLRSDMQNVQCSKLLLNLNNGINALAGIPIREMLSDRKYRRIIAACMKEAIQIYKSAGIKMVKLGKIIPGIAPAVLKLPDFLFFRVASTMINIDPTAMTSLAQDLIAGKKTEIDFLNGEIVRLARSRGLKAPINSAVVQLVKDAEATGQGSPRMDPEAMARALGLES